jgi:3-hydroxyacyl-CoA dehydrogenase
MYKERKMLGIHFININYIMPTVSLVEYSVTAPHFFHFYHCQVLEHFENTLILVHCLNMIF